MIKRTLHFGNPAYLSMRNNQLVIKLPEVEQNQTLPEFIKKEAIRTIPIEDIGVVILDNQQITLSHALLSAFMENNVALIQCDASHHPLGLMLPLHSNTVQHERYQSQLASSEPLRKQLWAQVVAQKVKNQAIALAKSTGDGTYLEQLSKQIKSGDSNNIEGTAAAYYWKRIFTQINDFKRFREGSPPNNYLNYAYSLLRANMARCIVAAGLLPTLGIHHHNRYNAYCLADDLMEPYRPFADLVVVQLSKQIEMQEHLTKDHKIELLKIPSMDVIINDENSPLMVAMQKTAYSLVKCYDGQAKKLVLPTFKT